MDIMEQIKFKRDFYSGNETCKLGCLYCFADIEGFKKLDVVKFSNNKNSECDDVLIYYPSCDTEFIWTDSFDKFIDNLLTSKNKAIISISTKGKLRKLLLEKIKSVNNKLIGENKGFIKFSVSITNKSMINVIEPQTSNYQERLSLLSYLRDHQIPSSIILKPILPFIATEEYLEIIDDTFELTDNYLLGGLYISKENAFYQDYIKDKFKVENKQADWLPYKPMWGFIASTEKIGLISNYILSKNKSSFLSDLDLLESMWIDIIETKIL